MLYPFKNVKTVALYYGPSIPQARRGAKDLFLDCGTAAVFRF
jgi:hypothetical protein